MVGLYVHWPFCKRKCPYCDFNSHVSRKTIDHDAYERALLADLKHDATRIGAGKRILNSIYFGGGTPSLMAPRTVEAVIHMADSLFTFSSDMEITLEANPTSSDEKTFQNFRYAGINRLSLGVQSLNDAALRSLGRDHTVDDALRAVGFMQKTFPRWSFDLIYARENQNLIAWQQELEQAINHIGGHVSLYQLTVEDGTVFKSRFDRGQLTLPGEDLSAEMYLYTASCLRAHGYVGYEISNYAKPGDEARHNLLYWRYGDYIGIGAGAHGRITTESGKWATQRHAIPEKWCKTAPENYVKNTPLNTKTQLQEYVVMGMRLKQGIVESSLKKRFGCSFCDIFSQRRLQLCLRENLLVLQDGALRFTLSGRLVLNAVLKYIIR